MQEMNETIEDFFENVDLKPYNEMDFENMANMLQHWTSDKVGRARINIPNSALITSDWVQSNVSHIQRLATVRNKCKQCRVKDPKKCIFDEENRRQVRKYEHEEGLDEGTIKVDTLLSRICVENCGKPDRAEHELRVIRPDLFYKNEKLYMAYGPCPVND